MNIINKSANTKLDRLWMVSGGKLTNLDLSRICKEPLSGPVMEYDISELTQYLLNPNPITLEENVIGCKIQYSKPKSGKIMRVLKMLFSAKGRSDNDSFTEEIISSSKTGSPDFNDKRLNLHFLRIKETLKLYDPVQKKLAGLNPEKIDNITAMCEDIGKNRHQLNLKGSINDKLKFVANSLSKKVKVAFNRAYLLNGLFEMRGFNFSAFDPDKMYRLIKINDGNTPKHCVLNDNYKFLYWIEDNPLINYMHLFQQSIKTDPQLREALNLCMLGLAEPLKLFFSTQREQSYSEKYLPRVYREVLSALNLGPNEMKSISNILNQLQSIVTFNYVPLSGTEKNKMYTNISVMHDLRALEPIKSSLPEVYSQIDKKALISDAGKLYLLDSMRGYQNV